VRYGYLVARAGRPMSPRMGSVGLGTSEYSGGGKPLARARSLRQALAQLSSVAIVLGGTEVVLVLTGPVSPAWVAALPAAAAAIYLSVGVLAWSRRPSSGIGALLTAGAATLLLAGMINTDRAVLIAVGRVTATVILAVVVHLLVAFPTGRLTSRPSRVLVATAYVTAIVLEAPLYLFSAFPSPYDALQVADRPDLVRAGELLQRGVGLVVVGVTAAVLVRRLHGATIGQRRVLLPLYVYGVVAVLFVPLTASMVGPLLGWTAVTTFVVQAVLLMLIPVAFGASILRGGFARTAEIEALGAWLGADEGGRPSLRDALAGSLGDPSLELAFWIPGRRRYVDGGGRPVTLPVDGSGWSSVEIDLAGQRVGAISYDSTLIDEPELVRTAGRVVAIAVDRDRLIADMRVKQEALRQSRRRIVEAGDRERRRIERNLHDGAQQRMMSVALGLRLAEARVDGTNPEVRALITGAADELDDAMRHVRELARGLHPALLADAGLAGALESLSERSSIPVRLSIRLDTELPEPIQVGAYYVVAEAVTNAAKHSGADRVTISAECRGGRLLVEIVDDGAGGATVRPGSGLEGIADRVDSLGGRLDLASPAAGGTRLVVDLPCA
jgi:signal transduction histidine kinase